MKTILTSILVLITIISFAQEPPEKYHKIWDYIGIGDETKAKKGLEKILKTKPQDPWPYWMMGILFDNEESKANNYTYFEQAIAIDSSFAPAYASWASRIEYDSLNYGLAENLYTKAVELEPKDNHHYVARGELYLRQNKYDLAIKDAKSAKLIEPGDCYFANQIIIKSLYGQGKMTDLKAFLKLNDPNDGGGPPEGEYQFFLGELYESWGEPQKACPYFKQAVADTEFFLEMFDSENLHKLLEKSQAKVAATCK